MISLNINIILDKLQNYRQFRLLYAFLYTNLKKAGYIQRIKKIIKYKGSDPWADDKANTKFRHLYQTYSVDFNRLIAINTKKKIGFLSSMLSSNISNFVISCDILGIDYDVLYIQDPQLLSRLVHTGCDGLMIDPAHDNNIIRQIFHEISQVISFDLKTPIYPTFRELSIYEAKRSLINFLVANQIPHPKTYIFYDNESAITFVNNIKFPIVFKTSIGASASGVEIIHSKKDALKLIDTVFNKYYLRKYETDKRSMEWGYIILQDFIENVKEYRIVKIGDSWFGHQKWKTENQVFLSGSGVHLWSTPCEELLEFCYNIAQRHCFTTMCFDVFENAEGQYMINELQTWFGSYDPSEMFIDGVPGRFRKLEGKWVFETGLYNVQGSVLLRLVDFISILDQNT